MLLMLSGLNKQPKQERNNPYFALSDGFKNQPPPDKLKITIVAGLPLPLLKLINSGEGRWQGDVGG